jgi:PAS domain S-box-containing protein
MPTHHEAIKAFFTHARAGLYAAQVEVDETGLTAERPLAVNPALPAMLGYSTADPAIFRFFEAAHFPDRTARDGLLRALLRDHEVTDYPLQVRTRRGVARWTEVTGCAVSTGNGQFRVDAIVRDVTERYERDERTRSLYRKLAESERQAAIGRTLAELSHELRNPLSTILAWAERLSLQRLDEVTHKGVSEIQSASERAARIARNALHAVSRRQSTRAMVDVNDIVRETLALRQHEHRASNVTVVTSLTPALPAVLGDAHQLQQVLLNLIINAEQAMASIGTQGVLTVRTSLDDGRGLATIEVADTGPGVEATVRSRVFDPYFTTRESTGGSGLGLAVAQSLVREHGGSLRLAEPAGGGAAFIVELPVSRRSGA